MTKDDLEQHMQECASCLLDVEQGSMVFIAMAIPSLGQCIHIVHNFPATNYPTLAEALAAYANDLLLNSLMTPTPHERTH